MKCVKKHHTDKIIRVTGSANYSDEFIEKQKCVRYGSYCSLWNTRIAGEIFTEGLTDDSSRGSCATTLWKYGQIQGRISSEELSNQKIDFSGKLYIEGYWLECTPSSGQVVKKNYLTCCLKLKASIQLKHCLSLSGEHTFDKS